MSEVAEAPIGDQATTDAPAQSSAEAPANQQPAAAPAEAAKPAEGAKPAAPAEVEIKLPEGETLDEAAIAAIKADIKDLGLEGEAAQKYADKRLAAEKSFVEKQQAMFKESVSKWAAEARADKEIGGDAFDANLATAKKALDTFASEGLREMLNSTGFGSHPEVIRLFHKIGAAISEDRLVTGKAPDAPADPAKRLFPNQH